MAKKRVDDDLKRDLSGRELRALLNRAHLPRNYPQLSASDQATVRKHVLTSWFDPAQPHILCTDVDNFVAASFLWSEFYMKPAEMNKGVYYFDDPLNKPDMIRLVMAPPLIPTEPAKTLITATRRLFKTQTIVLEMTPMIAVMRPFSLILVSEFNDTRTIEEISKIKEQIEENEIIHQDFGGAGVLHPKKTMGTWSTHHLKFAHQPGCEIMGHSMWSAQRGRGPILGIIDDPEDETVTFNKDWRKKFFARLFDVYIPMFTHGGKIVWIGTPIHSGSCLSLAVRGMSEKNKEEGGLEGEGPTQDNRFKGWNKGQFSLIRKDADGNLESVQPQRLSVEGFLQKMEIDPISCRKEILCEPVTPGIRAFPYDSIKHGFMHCQGRDGGQEYMLDLYTGEEKPWKTFLEEVYTFGAGDPADGQSAEADPGALSIIGVDAQAIIFVFDCYNRRCHVEDLIAEAYDLADLWECGVFGWEKSALQVVISRMARKYAENLADTEGRIMPVHRELDNAKKNKIRRILSIRGLFNRHQIRFRYLGGPVEGPDGVTHTPVDYVRKGHYQELVSQVVEYTDEGIRGHDDLIDATEMAIRLAGNRRGELNLSGTINPSDRILAGWREMGLPLSVAQVPEEARTEKMVEELNTLPEPDDLSLVCTGAGVLPYV